MALHHECLQTGEQPERSFPVREAQAKPELSGSIEMHGEASLLKIAGVRFTS